MFYKERLLNFWIGENIYIDLIVKIEILILIGDNCRIGLRVYIELGSVIGDNVIIGVDVNVKCFIVWNGILVGEDINL